MDFRNDVSFRKERLQKLLEVVTQYETEIFEALKADFGKPPFETFVSETSIVMSELRRVVRNIYKWSKPQRVRSWLPNWPSSDYIYREPYGSVLILAPWNYPFQLAMMPLISAVAAGNSVTVKPSERTPRTSALIAEIVRLVFDPNHVEVYLGGPEVSSRLLMHRWDYIFFTGSVAVGRLVAAAAAQNLTPVTLELGGKNPCIVDHTANLRIAAKRICWGKFLNAGQTCIAPDYILVHQRLKMQLMDALKTEIVSAYGSDPRNSKDYARIIDAQNFERLTGLLEGARIVYGADHDYDNLYLAPTVVEANKSDALMAGEIFGPILPVLAYETEDDIAGFINEFEKPLAMYVFSQDKSFSKRIMSRFAFGGGCINDTMIHFSNHRLPFGGVGNSGMGAYHGKLGFETFSHRKAVVSKPAWPDIPLRYAPYSAKKFAWVRRILNRF